MANTKYYAVVAGRTPGIYTDWESCKKMTNGYPCAIFKSFRSRKEAEDFMNASTHKTSTNITHDAVPFIDKTKIYTDGSYSNNKSGFGVIIIPPNGDKIEAYGPVPYKQTNSTAELYAVYVALSLTQSKEVIIYVDSTYVMNSLTSWIHSWKLSGWKGVANVDLIKAIYDKMQDRNIVFQHVKAHAGHQLNEEVDTLANLGRDCDQSMIIKWNGVLYSPPN